jgi:hypothetical protein
LTVYSGDAASPQSKVLPDIILSPGGFSQINEILNSNGLILTNGYVRVTRISGNNPFITYSVINDGGVPGARTSDGAFIASAP